MTKPATKDIKGRHYAKLQELKVGDAIELDGGFTCAKAGTKIVKQNERGELYFPCKGGRHMLVGQADDGIHCIGVYKVSR